MSDSVRDDTSLQSVVDRPARWLSLELARPEELDHVRRTAPVAYLPWGALEFHGAHNPLGLDGLKAKGICEALAAVTGGVVVPTVYAGTDTMKVASNFGNTLEHASGTVMQLASEYLDQLADMGFRVIVLITGHYGADHVLAIKAAAAEVAARRSDVRIWAIADHEPVDDVFEPNHAARGETSYAMLLAPGTVQLDRLPAHRVATLAEDGVWGTDPRSSSAEHGAEQLQAMVLACAPRIAELLAGVDR